MRYFAASLLAPFLCAASVCAQTCVIGESGRTTVALPLDATRIAAQNEHASRYHSNALSSVIVVSYTKFPSAAPVRERLTKQLQAFVSDYGSVESLVSIRDASGRLGMNIRTEIAHGTGGMRYTYVESRIFAENDKLFYVTIETEVNVMKPENFKTAELSEIFTSMRTK